MIYAVAALALILGIAAVAVGYIALNQNPSTNSNYSSLVGLKETRIIMIHSSAENATTNSTFENSNWTASYEPGKMLTITESLYTTSNDGVTVLTNVVANTPGFLFESSSPSFPTLVPYAANASGTTQVVNLTFLTPSMSYSGDLEYTLYLNYTQP